MLCLSPDCNGEAGVIHTESMKGKVGIKRRRECNVCRTRLTTYELSLFQGHNSGEMSPLTPYTIRVLISNQYLRQYEYIMRGEEAPESEAIEIESTIQAFWKVLNLAGEQRELMEGLCRERAKSLIERRMFEALDAELEIRQEKRRQEKAPNKTRRRRKE